MYRNKPENKSRNYLSYLSTATKVGIITGLVLVLQSCAATLPLDPVERRRVLDEREKTHYYEQLTDSINMVLGRDGNAGF